MTRRSGGVVCRHFDDLDAILESDTSDNLRQLIFTLQPPPGIRGGEDQLEYHQLGDSRWPTRSLRIRSAAPAASLIGVANG